MLGIFLIPSICHNLKKSLTKGIFIPSFYHKIKTFNNLNFNICVEYIRFIENLSPMFPRN